MNTPLISIITPTLNSGATLEQTILSVLNQEYKEIEHIFIDGLSSDNTTHIIHSYKDRYKHFRFVSEKDNGIYDAMNKGLDLCKGDWVYFMGAGDEFYNEHILQELVEQGWFNEEQVVYGNVIISGETAWAEDKSIYDGPFTLEKLFKKNICHQSIFYPRSVIKQIGYYSDKYEITGDWDYNVHCFANYKFAYIDKIIARFKGGGTSSGGGDYSFYDDLPEKVIQYFHLDPNDKSLYKPVSPFYDPMNRYREAEDKKMNVTIIDSDLNKFNLNPFTKEITEGISLITAIKNRKDTFEEALQTWVAHEQIDEIIIVDWDSDESLIPLVQKYQNGKIFLAVVRDQPKWILSFAYNLAARLTTRTHILKIDADVKILPGFFEKHILESGKFYCGNWRNRRNDNEMHLNGIVYLQREDFFRVNGYNEFITSYGWDDSDLYQRLVSAGLNRNDFDIDTLQHIAHEARTALQSTAGYFKNMTDLEKSNLNILTNRYLCTKLLKWSLQNKMLGFAIQVEDNNTWICSQSSPDPNTVPAEYYLESETNAVKERLKQFEFGIHDDLVSYLKRDEIIEYYNLFLSKESDKTASDLFNVISKFNYQYSATIANKNIEIEKLEDEVNSRNAEVYKIMEELLDKNSQIDYLSEQQHFFEQVIQTKENEIKNKGVLLEQKDETIHQLNQIIEAKENLILSKDKELHGKDLEIHQNKTEILKQNITIQGNESVIRQLNTLIDQQNSTLKELELQIETLRRDLHEKEKFIISTQEQLNSIYRSYSWRTGHFFFSLISKVFFWVPGIGKREH